MAKKKMDFGKIKELLIAKGERAGLAVCLAIGAGLLVLGVISGMSNSKKDWVTPFEQGAVRVRDAVARAEAEKKGEIQPIPIWRKGDNPLDIPDPSFIKFNENARRNRVMPRALPVIEGSDPKEATKFPHSHGLTVLSEHKDAQVDYLLAGVRAYEINFDGEKYTRIGAGSQGRLSEAIQPHRLIVVQLAYNMKKQFKEFADALGITEKELLADPTQWPHVMGMDIIKYEQAPGSDKIRERKIYEFQPHETVATKMYKVEPKSLDRLFRSMVFETEQTGALNDHIFIGLVSPVPQLLTGPLDPKTTDRKNKQVRYPEVRLEGIGIAAGKDGGLVPDGPPAPGKPFMPKMPKPGGSDGFAGMPKGNRGDQMPGVEGGGGAAGEPNDQALSKLRDENGQLYFRVRGGYYPFDPNGEPPERRERGAGGPGAPAPGVPNMPGPGAPLPGPGKFGPPKAGRGEDERGGEGAKGPGFVEPGVPGHFETTRLIRFIDIEAQPGYSYVYGIQIYLANPFHGKRDAESLAWSKEKLLPKPSPLSYTPPVTVPGEFFYYTMDQENRIADLPRGNDTKDHFDRVPLQLQRYVEFPVDRDTEKKHEIADWVIAEKILVRRGGIIGQRWFEQRTALEKKSHPDYITVEAPEWHKEWGSNGEFRIPGDFKPGKKGQAAFKATGFQMAFGGPNQPRPVLVDFVGGRHLKADLGSAYEVLVLDAAGKLILRNSNADTADFDRRRRYDHWTTRIEQTRRQLQGEGAPGGPGMPAPGMPGPGGPQGPRGG